MKLSDDMSEMVSVVDVIKQIEKEKSEPPSVIKKPPVGLFNFFNKVEKQTTNVTGISMLQFKQTSENKYISIKLPCETESLRLCS